MSTRYNVGDRVVIVSERTNSMNDEGKMDKYLGTVMTIREVGCTGNSALPYSMVEDAEDYFYNNHKGWERCCQCNGNRTCGKDSRDPLK